MGQADSRDQIKAVVWSSGGAGESASWYKVPRAAMKKEERDIFKASAPRQEGWRAGKNGVESQDLNTQICVQGWAASF